MSAISSSSPSAAIGQARAGDAVSAPEISASCRPVLLLFLSATGWLLAGSAFAIIASLKFHAPKLLADCAWFTYGRVHPAHLNCFLYGFGIQAGLGVMLWLLASLGRTRLAMAPAVIAGWALWNLGVTAGVLGILYGESTGYEWLEIPRYGSSMMFFGYLFLGLAAMLTFHQRRERQVYVSHWFILAALFWFAWIYSTANFLLVARPVRGTLQAAVDFWYVNNLGTIWFGFTGLAAIFYFVPKISGRPLNSHYLGMFIFVTLALFGSWGGIPAGTPLPSWMSALSTMGTVITVAPVVAVAVCVRQTLAGAVKPYPDGRSFRFIRFSVFAYVIAGIATAIASLIFVSKITNFTWFAPACVQLFLYGFFALAMFGAIYQIVPEVLGTGFCRPSLVGLHFFFAAAGILIYAIPLAIGGIQQGLLLDDPAQPFVAIMTKTLTYLRISTLGDLLMLGGHIVLAVNLFGIVARVGRAAATEAWAANTRVAEVAA